MATVTVRVREFWVKRTHLELHIPVTDKLNMQLKTLHAALPSITGGLSHLLTGTKGFLTAFLQLCASSRVKRQWCHPSSHPHTVFFCEFDSLSLKSQLNPPCLTSCLRLRPTTSYPKAQKAAVYWTPIIQPIITHPYKHTYNGKAFWRIQKQLFKMLYFMCAFFTSALNIVKSFIM